MNNDSRQKAIDWMMQNEPKHDYVMYVSFA